MDLNTILMELEILSSERVKKYYISQGAKEPLFGVPTGEMKALLKKVGKNQDLAEQLYQTGNYDAMYFAGMIAKPNEMTKEDYFRWMESAYFFMISDFIVAVTLAESEIAFEVADELIQSGKELYMSAGWACYEWLLGNRLDHEFDIDKLRAMLDIVRRTIHNQPNRTRYAMNNFVSAVGVSYKALTLEALAVANEIGNVEIETAKGACKIVECSSAIQKAIEKNKTGFKRRNVRC